MRRLLSLAAAAVILTVLMGCGNKDETDTGAVKLDKKPKTESSGGGSPQSGG